MVGHLNSFSASGGGNLNNNFPKIQMPGGLPGGGCLSFDLTDTLPALRSIYLPLLQGRLSIGSKRHY